MPFKKKLFFIICFAFSCSLFSQEIKLDSIKFNGLQRTKESFVKDILTHKNEDILDSLAIENNVIFLKRLPAFTNVSYQITKNEKGNYNLTYFFEENRTIIPSINIWTTTNDVFSYKLGLYEYNFLGKNITLGGFYQFNGFDTYVVNFNAPNLFSRNWGLAINHQNWKSEEPLFFNNQSANYLYNNISFEVLGLYQFNYKNKIRFGVNFFEEKYRYITGATDPTIPQNLDLSKVLFKSVYTFDNLNYNYQYVSGFKNQLFTQYVVTENDFQNDFYIFWNDLFYFRRMGPKGNWANRLRFGLSSNEASPFAPFALDNNVNLRGVGILVDRGTGSIVLNTEYRHTIYDKNWLAIQTNIFADAGSWRNPGGKLNDFFEADNLKIYSGVGLRFISKKVYNAVFRIDYGFSLLNEKNGSKGGLVFGIGQYF